MKIQIIFGVLIVGLLATIAFHPVQQAVGNIFSNDNAYSTGVTYASSTLTNSVATLLIPRAASSRTYAEVCVRASVGVIWIYKQATSTGVSVDQGHPLYASSTSSLYPQYDGCVKYDADDPYTGQVWGITDTTSSVAIEYKQE